MSSRHGGSSRRSMSVSSSSSRKKKANENGQTDSRRKDVTGSGGSVYVFLISLFIVCNFD
ncbi:hypothetical protein Hanom_Chr08g00746211 [Helianthus anomalus]